MVHELQAAAPELHWMVLEPLDRGQLEATSTLGRLPRMLQVC
jgi:hypothetical protein